GSEIAVAWDEALPGSVQRVAAGQVIEERRSAIEAETKLVGEPGADRRTQRDGFREAAAALAGDRAAAPHRTRTRGYRDDAVQNVGAGVVPVVVRNPGKVVLHGQVVVDAVGQEVALLLSGNRIREGVAIEVGPGRGLRPQVAVLDQGPDVVQGLGRGGVR